MINKEKMRKLASEVAAMTDAERAAMAAKILVITIERHVLSVRNTILCVMQCRTVTVVGGFVQWKTAGRCVKKGESALWIMHPCTKKTDTGEPGETFFRFAPVFDISQTDALSEVAA